MKYKFYVYISKWEKVLFIILFILKIVSAYYAIEFIYILVTNIFKGVSL